MKSPKKKFVLADDTELGYYQTYVDEICRAMKEACGVEPMFISDLSCIGDMATEDVEINKLSELLSVPIKYEDTFIDVAKRMKANA